MSKPLILVTNDDSIISPGINYLIDLMSKLGEVWVIAPDSPQSGKGHAVTVDNPIFCKEVKINNSAHREFTCSGTPSDSVKLAFSELLPKVPDLCVSGINHGSNASINTIYSGTVAGAVEASIKGVPSIAFSYVDASWEADLKPLGKYIKDISKDVLSKRINRGITLNVNFPKLKNNKDFKGIKYCRQARADWKEEFDRRKDPRENRNYYWMLGDFINYEKGVVGTDLWALDNNYISIVPIKCDFTDYSYLESLNVQD